MTPIRAFLLSSTLLVPLALPIQAQTPEGDAPAPASAEAASGEVPAEAGVESLIRKVDILTGSVILTQVPENEPLPLDMRLLQVPGVPVALTQGVTAKAYARHVQVEGQLVGQLVLTGVEKNGRIEPLNSAEFAAQFDLETPELSPSQPITVQGNEEALIAALQRLAEGGEEDAAPDQVVQAERDTTQQAGADAPRNDEASGYRSPEPLALPEGKEPDPVPIVRVTTEGCSVRIDAAQMQAIQQARVETTAGGAVSASACEDSNDRFPLQRSYSTCADALNLEARTATAQYSLYYVDGGGARQEVAECQPDADRVFPISEKAEACTVFVDPTLQQAVRRTALVYTNANNAEVQVRGCQPSDLHPPVPLALNTDACSLRHDFQAGLSHQRGQWTYEMDGITWQSGSCFDTGTTYAHETVYQTAGGQAVCQPIVNHAAGTVTFQSRKRIVAGGIETYVSDCTPDASGQVLPATTEGCTNPVLWTHNLSAGQSLGQQRFYYTRPDGQREYVTGCVDSEATYPHQMEIAGWDHNDAGLWSLRRTTIYITTPYGRHNVVTNEILPGTEQMAYIYEGQTTQPNGDEYFEGCTRFENTNIVHAYRRPDNSLHSTVIGPGAAVNRGNSCSQNMAERRWVNTGATATSLGTVASGGYADWNNNYQWVTTYSSTHTLRCSWDDEVAVVRSDGQHMGWHYLRTAISSASCTADTGGSCTPNSIAPSPVIAIGSGSGGTTQTFSATMPQSQPVMIQGSTHGTTLRVSMICRPAPNPGD